MTRNTISLKHPKVVRMNSSVESISRRTCAIPLIHTKLAKMESLRESTFLELCITIVAVAQLAGSFCSRDREMYEKRELAKQVNGSINRKQVIYGLVILTCWCLWKSRNEKQFNNTEVKVTKIVLDVKSLGYLWYMSRYKGAAVLTELLSLAYVTFLITNTLIKNVRAQHDNNIHPLRNGWNEDGNAEENNGTIDEGGNAEVNDGTIDEGGNAEVNDDTIDEDGKAEGSNVTIHEDWNAEVNNGMIDEDGYAKGSNVTIDEDGNAKGSNGTIDDDGNAEEVNEKSTPLNFNHLIKHDMEGRYIKELFVSSKEIAKGSNGTVVYEGIYKGRKVAVKCIAMAHLDIAFEEIQNLIVSDQHQHIVRLYDMEYDADFVYIALERCDCTLYDLIKNSESSQLRTQNGYPSAFLLKLMWNIVVALVHLHELKIIHRDLKPHNVLIKKGKIICPKLADMGSSRLLVGDASSLEPDATVSGTLGWRAPEQIRQERQTRAMDFFSLGCVLFFCITCGRHPFGDKDRDLDSNVTKNRRVNFSLVERIPEAVNLLTRLLNRNPEDRPKALEVLCHPLFWNPETRMSFLRDASDRVKLENENTVSIILIALKQKCGVAAIQEKKCGVASTGEWDVGMDPAFLSRMKHYRKYDNRKVQDLLRLIRNTVSHYGELPPSIQNLLGAMPEGVNNHFRIKFPKLLMKVYTVMHNHCKQEEWFHKYLET